MSATDPTPDNETVARSLWHNMRIAALATLDGDGTPHVSMVTPLSLDDGSALLLLSELARHTTNIKQDARCSLLVTEATIKDINPDNAPQDPLALERITVHGTIGRLQDKKIKAFKNIYLKTHPAAADYIDFRDFALYLFQPSRIFLVGGFGRIETLKPEILVKNHG